MTEEEKQAAAIEAAKNKPTVDAFGGERDKDGKPLDPKPEPSEDEKKKADDEKKKKEEGAGNDLENNPVVKGLKDALESVKKEMGGNLAGQRTVIERLEKELKEAREGKKPEAEPLFKDIKRVKDLPQADQDAMTDNEKKLFDQLADTHDIMNKQHAEAVKRDADARADAEKKEQDSKKTVSKLAQDEAKIAAGDDVDMANQILENFNLFAGNDALTPEQVKERIEKAALMVKGYKPPKEQKRQQGTAPKPGDAQTTEMAENDKIIDEVKKGKKSGYQL